MKSSKHHALLPLLGILLLSLLLAEALLRLRTWLMPESTVRNFEAFLSPAFMRVWPDGSVRYEPNAQVRIATVINDQVVFDQRYASNDFGLFDSLDYGATSWPEPRIALAGDSYTAGQGSPAWFPAFREQLAAGLEPISVFNLGLSGAGVMQVGDLTLALNPKLDFQKVVIPVICDDFRRRRWAPMRDVERWHLCLRSRYDAGQCDPPDRSFGIIVPNSTPASALPGWLSKAGNAATNVAQDLPWYRHAFHALRQRSRLVNLANNVRTAPAARRALQDLEQDNLRALVELGQRFGNSNVHVLWFAPDPPDAGTFEHCDSLRERTAKLPIVHADLRAACNVTRQDQHPIDLHLNPDGYLKLQACLTSYLRKMSLK